MSEHLIMNHDAPLSPEDTYAKMPMDTDEQLISREMYGREISRKVLDCLDPSQHSLQRHGTVEIDVWMNGEVVPYELRIKTIPAHIQERMNKKVRSLAMKMPVIWDANAQDNVYDRRHPQFESISNQMIELTQRQAYEKVLLGADLTLKSVDGSSVVWHPQNVELRDIDAAIKSLDAMGITESQISSIATAIDNLSRQQTEAEEEEDLKKSTPR